MKKEVSAQESAVLDMCKKVGVKFPSDLIGKKIILHVFDEVGEISKIYDTISQVLIEEGKDSNYAEIKLHKQVIIGGKNSYSLINFPDSKNWFFTIKKNEGREIWKKMSVEIFFPKKWLIFSWLVNFQVYYLDSE